MAAASLEPLEGRTRIRTVVKQVPRQLARVEDFPGLLGRAVFENVGIRDIAERWATAHGQSYLGGRLVWSIDIEPKIFY
jgi:hypothetical protein